MTQIPTLPLSGNVQEIVDFCVEFRSLAGFIAVYEQKLNELKPVRRGDGSKATAYEATEQIHQALFGHRRYPDVENFVGALSRYYDSKK